MNIKIVDGKTFVLIDELRPYDKNPRSITRDNYERLKRHIIKYGQYKPLLVTQEGVVVGGNMRLRAMQDLRIEEVWVSVVDASTDEKMIEYALSDNENYGEWDEEALAELLSTIGEEDLQELETEFQIETGKKAVEDLLKEVGPSEDETEKIVKEEKEDQKVCPNCGYILDGK